MSSCTQETRQDLPRKLLSIFSATFRFSVFSINSLCCLCLKASTTVSLSIVSGSIPALLKMARADVFFVSAGARSITCFQFSFNLSSSVPPFKADKPFSSESVSGTDSIGKGEFSSTFPSVGDSVRDSGVGPASAATGSVASIF